MQLAYRHHGCNLQFITARMLLALIFFFANAIHKKLLIRLAPRREFSLP